MVLFHLVCFQTRVVIFTLHKLNEETVVYGEGCIVPLLLMSMLIWEHYLQLSIIYSFLYLFSNSGLTFVKQKERSVHLKTLAKSCLERG